jgi:hypothetical protein
LFITMSKNASGVPINRPGDLLDGEMPRAMVADGVDGDPVSFTRVRQCKVNAV